MLGLENEARPMREKIQRQNSETENLIKIIAHKNSYFGCFPGSPKSQVQLKHE